MLEIEDLVRDNIKALSPYSTARNEFKGDAAIFLDANENAYGSPAGDAYNRYPDPLQQVLKDRIAALKAIPVANIFLGNGSDEGIDLLYRIFCRPGMDKVVICEPTYGMYEVCAAIHNVEVVRIDLSDNYVLDTNAILNAGINARMLFICSPNNPTGNACSVQQIEKVIQQFKGIVVVDEAYIDYSTKGSVLQLVPRYNNLVVLQTFSKAWGLAGIRLGMAFANEKTVGYLNKVKPPYNISTPNMQLAIKAIENEQWVQQHVTRTLIERDRLNENLALLPCVIKVYPTDANFILVRFTNARAVYSYLMKAGIIVRDRSNVKLCDECLRITVGTFIENEKLITALKCFTI